MGIRFLWNTQYALPRPLATLGVSASGDLRVMRRRSIATVGGSRWHRASTTIESPSCPAAHAAVYPAPTPSRADAEDADNDDDSGCVFPP